MEVTYVELQSQWGNPSDILSLLLLIGGDIVQKAIAQLVGYRLRLFGKNGLSIGLTPVAFSFGWVAYGFTNLLSCVGEQKLMPKPECASLVVNCANGFTRTNESWVLERILRDHETTHEVDATNPADHYEDDQIPVRPRRGRGETIRIDIFELGLPSEPTLDLVWWLGWLTIAVQIGVACIPWVLYGDWGIVLVILCGNFLAIFTCALPQWHEEKWAAKTLTRENVTCLTRGNGHLHIMVFIGLKGSWNMEVLATASSIPRPTTAPISMILSILWTCLLISVSGLKAHAWYLVAIGGLGMLQNIFAAGKVREPGASNIHFKKFSRMPTIIGKRQHVEDDLDSTVDLDEALGDVSEFSVWGQSSRRSSNAGSIEMPQWVETMDQKDGVPAWLEPLKAEQKQIANIHGALIELEKWVPTAGLAMMQTFFPTNLRYMKHCVRDNVHKKFWKRAYCTKSIRSQGERKRRERERRRDQERRKGNQVIHVEKSQV